MLRLASSSQFSEGDRLFDHVQKYVLCNRLGFITPKCFSVDECINQWVDLQKTNNKSIDDPSMVLLSLYNTVLRMKYVFIINTCT